jgi:hypothetical protein
MTIPIFQFIDDETQFKHSDKAVYENTEAFISAFENCITMNDLDINEVWMKYIGVSFVAGNRKYIRFYKLNIKTLPKGTEWKGVKKLIIQKYGEFANNTLKVKIFIDIKQSNTEKTCDYVDRYAEAYSGVINSNEGQMQQLTLESARFLNTLLPIAKQEIEKALKNQHREGMKTAGTIYPDSLFKLYTFLNNNMGDTQEEINSFLAKVVNMSYPY